VCQWRTARSFLFHIRVHDSRRVGKGGGKGRARVERDNDEEAASGCRLFIDGDARRQEVNVWEGDDRSRMPERERERERE
jgi:hypothetical protein